MGYQASADGTSKGKTSASIGDGQDINGRAIVVHDKTGARVACALIEGKLEQRRGNVQPYPGYSGSLKVTGDVKGYLSRSGNAYVTYTLNGLEDACKSTPEGVANACGIHIHEGKTCDDADAVGGHFYDKDTVESDPWASKVYTSKGEFAYGSFKTEIGTDDIKGRALVVHDSTGGRVACGLIPSAAE